MFTLNRSSSMQQQGGRGAAIGGNYRWSVRYGVGFKSSTPNGNELLVSVALSYSDTSLDACFARATLSGPSES
jgi:hypothetical protein